MFVFAGMRWQSKSNLDGILSERVVPLTPPVRSRRTSDSQNYRFAQFIASRCVDLWFNLLIVLFFPHLETTSWLARYKWRKPALMSRLWCGSSRRPKPKLYQSIGESIEGDRNTLHVNVIHSANHRRPTEAVHSVTSIFDPEKEAEKLIDSAKLNCGPLINVCGCVAASTDC